MASSIDIAGGTTPILHSDGYYKRTDAIAALFPGCNPATTWQAARKRNRRRETPLPLLAMIKIRSRGSLVNVDGIALAQIAELARFVVTDPLQYFTGPGRSPRRAGGKRSRCGPSTEPEPTEAVAPGARANFELAV
jgi:hypothetical protein